jgi:flavin reductase (DIM6/NTAB) family NADH-FMN oxidoreductase RutF/DNA-binding MarR family transcriptional regulator
MYDFSYINQSNAFHCNLIHRQMTSTNFNPRELRNCLGEFTTGVTVITCNTAGEQPVGVTANSFSALSLEPPLVLWSLAKKSGSLALFNAHGYFAVNVLSNEQQETALAFSRPSADRFNGVDFILGQHKLPLINDCLAYFCCKVTQALDQGDHVLFIGEVLEFSQSQVQSDIAKRPLVFSRGKFADLAPEAIAPSNPISVATSHSTTFYKDYLPYLLARAANDSASHFHSRLKNYGLNMLSWRVLASLSDGTAWTVNDLCRVSLAKQPTISKLLDRLEEQRLIRRTPDTEDARKVMVTLTKTGGAKINPVIAEAQGYGDSLSGKFAIGELDVFKATLKKLIAAQ